MIVAGDGTEFDGHGRRIFNFQKAYAILDELIIAGELQESSKKSVLRVVGEPVDPVEKETDLWAGDAGRPSGGTGEFGRHAGPAGVATG